MEEKSLAVEMLQEVKQSSKRWFIIAIVELLIIVSFIISLFIYESQYEVGYTIEEQMQNIDNTKIDNSNINQY